VDMSELTEKLKAVHRELDCTRKTLEAVMPSCNWLVSPKPLDERLTEDWDTSTWVPHEEWFESSHWSQGDTWLAAAVSVPGETEGVPLAGSPAHVFIKGWNPFSLYVDGKLLEQEPTVWYATGPALIPLPKPVEGGHTYRFVMRMTTCEKGLVAGGMDVRLVIDSLATLREEIETVQAELRIAEALAETEKQRDALGAAAGTIDITALAKRDWQRAVASFRQAENQLKPLWPLAKELKLHLIGHSHIDMNWMWTWPDTVDVTRRDFRSVTTLMDEFPQLTFTHSQVPTYQIVKHDDPDIFDQVKQRIAEGRWEAATATWVEADLNMTSGEAIARHFLYAIRWSRSHLGVTPEVVWEPDTVGHPANIPQLVRLAGIERYFHMRCNPLRPDRCPLYWWEGMDGSRILAVSNMYVGELTPDRVIDAILLHHRQGSRVGFLMYGLGDHGGGPTRSNMKTLERLQNRPLMPELVCSTMGAYCSAALKEGVPIPVFSGELNTVFEGCYTTHADIKRLNRQGENLLLTAEALGALAGTDERGSVASAWQRVLFNQFHDLLDGSSIAPAYADCARQHEKEVRTVAEKAIETAADALAARADTRGDGLPVVVINPIGLARTDVVRLHGINERIENPALVAPDASERPGQWCGEELTFVADAAPAFGHIVYHLKEGAPARALVVEEQETDWVIETPFYRALVHKESGIIDALFDKRTGRQLVAYGVPKWSTEERTARRDLALNVLQFCEEPPHPMSAWLIDSVRAEHSLISGARVELKEVGPVRVVIHAEHRLRRSKISQDIILYRDLPRIDFPTVLDWQEVGTPEAGVPMLKVSFTAHLNRPAATYEIPYGAVSRAADGQEVPALRWADLSEEDGTGISLINDCKYGYDALGSRLRLTLVRCAYEPDRISDTGQHKFTYSLLPHGGTWREAETVGEAIGVNQPLIARLSDSHQGQDGPALARMWTTGLPSVIISSVKCPEDGEGSIAHMYESAGRAGAATLRSAAGIHSAEEVNLLEETQQVLSVKDGSVVLSFRPWEVKCVAIKPH